MTAVPLSDLKTVVALYLQKDFPATESHPLFAQGDESAVSAAFDTLFLRAANNAVMRAQTAHDFHFMLKTLGGTIPSGTAGLSVKGMTEYGGGSTFDVKTLQTCFVVGTDGTFTPYRHESRKRTVDRMIEQEDLRMWDQVNENLENKFLLHGDKIYTYPTNTTSDTSIALDAYVWETQFTDVSDVSDFITYGYEFMQWATIVELNHLLQTFVPRQEGGLNPPVKERDDALRRFIEWDVYQTEAGRNVILD